MWHYAAAVAAKAAEPRAPSLWTYIAAAELLDIGWSTFIITGLEKARIDAALPVAPLDLYDLP